MAGTHRDLNKSQCPQLTTHGRLIKRDAKLFEYPLGKVLPTPAHHTVDCRDRTVLNNPRKRPAVFVIELGRLAPSLAINQTIWAFAIEPEDPIADHLKSNIADPGRVRQILINLVGNAVKFTRKGHVAVRVTGLANPGQTDCTVHITVEDTGVGMSPEEQAQIFGEFQQVASEANREFEGTGLGLAITRRLVDALGLMEIRVLDHLVIGDGGWVSLASRGAL